MDMETFSSTRKFNICIVLIVIATVTKGAKICPQDSLKSGDVCFRYFDQSERRSWASAQKKCQSLHTDGRLLVDEGGKMASYLVEHLNISSYRAPDWPDIWIGGKREMSQWRWVGEDLDLTRRIGHRLGCFYNDVSGAVLVQKEKAGEYLITPVHCAKQCHRLFYIFALLTKGNECHCSYNVKYFTRSKLVSPSRCDSTCSGDPSLRCGGQLYFDIYYLNNSYMFWEPGNPLPPTGYKNCVAMRSSDYVTYLWECRHCADINHFACSKVNSEPVNTCLNISGGIFRVKDKCYTVTISSYATTWMAAHRKCKQDGGDLITIVDSDMQTSLIQMVHLRGLVFSVQHIWIGLTNRKWQWVTGKTIMESLWHNEFPSSPGDNCITMTYLDSKYAWNDRSCNQKHSFICQTPAYDAKKNTGTNFIAPQEPDVVLLTSIILGVILFLLLVTLAVILIFRHRKKRRERKVEYFDFEDDESTGYHNHPPSGTTRTVVTEAETHVVSSTSTRPDMRTVEGATPEVLSREDLEARLISKRDQHAKRPPIYFLPDFNKEPVDFGYRLRDNRTSQVEAEETYFQVFNLGARGQEDAINEPTSSAQSSSAYDITANKTPAAKLFRSPRAQLPTIVNPKRSSSPHKRPSSPNKRSSSPQKRRSISPLKRTSSKHKRRESSSPVR